MDHDVDFQRAIFNSLRETRTTTTNTFRPRNNEFRLRPTVPTRIASSPQRNGLGRRDTLKREGIAPAVSSSVTSLPPNSGASHAPLYQTDTRFDPEPSPPEVRLRKSITEIPPPKKLPPPTRVPPKVSSSSVASATREAISNVQRLPFRDGESYSQSSAPPTNTRPGPTVGGWKMRESSGKVSFTPQNSSGANFSVEASGGHAICTNGGFAELAKEKPNLVFSCTNKLFTATSRLQGFFIVLDYHPPTAGLNSSFLAICACPYAAEWRVEYHIGGPSGRNRTPPEILSQCEDRSLKTGSWNTIRVSYINRGKLTVDCGDSNIFKDIDVSVVKKSPQGSIGIGVYDSKLQSKEWSIESSGGFEGYIDPKLADMIQRDIMHTNLGVEWDSIASLGEAKRLLQEAAILPLVMPDFFTGLRQPWRGVLLFGPPGTGKTLLAKAVATCAKTTFFNVSASSLLSKWLGESERLVRTLFQMARKNAPSTIFFDEIDALAMSRGSTTEHEASRRLKSELLSQMDGMNTGESNGLVMVLATSNKPWDLDEAFRRRLEKRIYVPLPDHEARKEMFKLYLKEVNLAVGVEVDALARMSHGYSGADIHQVCRDAAMMPMRRLISQYTPMQLSEMGNAKALKEIPISQDDLALSLKNIQPSVAEVELERYSKWQQAFGSL